MKSVTAFIDVGRSPHITTLVFSAINTQLNNYFFSGLTVESCGLHKFATYGTLSYRNCYAQYLINVVQDSSVVAVKRLRTGLPRQGHRVVSSPNLPGQLLYPSSGYRQLFLRADVVRA
jgi:hypothetical protein